MRKFILIDQSIKDSGGHHLEYALRVLSAAKKLGFQSILGTHKDCSPIANENIDVVEKAFRHTFWDNFRSEIVVLGPKERRFLNVMKTKKDQFLYALMCSPLGFSYMVAKQGLRLPAMMSRYGVATSTKQLSMATILVGYMLVRGKRLIEKMSRRLGLGSSTARRLGRTIFISSAGLVGLICSPILLPYLLLRWRKIFGRADFYASQFADDLQRLLVHVNASSGDIIFIPTLGNVELVGTGICTKRFPIEDIHWHFLFRRNIFHGREPVYQAQIEEQHKTLQAFSAVKLDFPEGYAHFYTDTEALTEQYNRLGYFRFKTLPIPLDTSLERSTEVRSHLNITYIGDARDEKGFPLLPRLVGDLRAAGYSQDAIRFVFQSNFNTPGGEPGARVARAELATESKEFVSLVEGPFDSEQYTTLINNADILLVPYDNQNYYARSSGIFAEALAAGAPFLASDKSWMSQELFQRNQNYYKDLLLTARIFQSPRMYCDGNVSQLRLRPISSQSCAWFLVEINQLFDNPGQYLHICWSTLPEVILKADRAASFFRQFTVDLRATPAYALMRLPAKREIVLEFKIDDGRGAVQLLSKANVGGLSVTVHELELGSSVPLFQGGALYSQDVDFSAAVIEVLEKYQQYAMQSREYRKAWTAFHNSEVLVRILDGAVT